MLKVTALQSPTDPAAMWINSNAVTTATVLLLSVIGAVVAQSRTPGKRPSGSSSQAPKRQQTSSSSAEAGDKGGDLTDECPEPNGYFADAYQCDKYYECREGVITEKLCPDGMVFNDYSINQEKCDLPFNIDCSQRSERQEPKPSLHCPRQNGYFGHEEANVCDKFYFCVDGKYNQIVCPDGLVYNEKTGICTWPDEAKKKGCSSQGVLRQKRNTPPPFYSLGGGVIQRRYLVNEKPKEPNYGARIQARVTSGYALQGQHTGVKPRYSGMYDHDDYDDHDDFYDDDYDFKSEDYEDISISELINDNKKKGHSEDDDEDDDEEDEDKGGEEGEDDRESRERGSRERGSREKESKESKEKGSKSSEEDSDERGDIDYDYYVYHDYEEGDRRGRSNARKKNGDRSMASVEEAERRRWEAPRTDAERLATFNNDRRTVPIAVYKGKAKNKGN